MMADILNPWIELESDNLALSSFSQHFPLPLQEVKVEVEDSETSASSYRENGDFSHGHTTYISLDSYERISSPPSSYSHESLSPATTNSDNSVTSPSFVHSASLLPESTSSSLAFQYSPAARREECRTPSDFLNPATPLNASDAVITERIPMEDYRHHSGTPYSSALGLNGFHHDLLHYDINHPLYSHWANTSSPLEISENRSTPEQPRTFSSGDQLLEERVSRECVNCGSSSAVLWWQDGTGHFLCNSCSQTLKTIPDNTLMYKDIRKSQKRTTATTKRTAMVCTNCKADKTSLWRRNNLGETVCNACGLYFKLHKCNRPITMKKDSIQKRKRKPKATQEKSKGSSSRSMKEPKKVQNGISSLRNSPDVVVKQEIVDTTYATPTSQSFHSSESDYLNNMRLLPPVYSPDGFRTSLSPSPGLYMSSNYTSISPISSLPVPDNLPGVDIFQSGRSDYAAMSQQQQPSVLSAMSC